MFHKILFSGFVLFILALGMVLHHFSDASDLLKKYQKFGFVASDLKYEKVQKSWGGQGLIFYQVQFPFMRTPMQADVMSFALADTRMKMKLKNVHIQVISGLQSVYGNDVAKSLDAYVPYRDFFRHLLISMAVMGIDEFVGDIDINTVYEEETKIHLSIQMEQKKAPIVQMKGKIHIPIVGAHQFSDLWNGQMESVQVKLSDSLFNRYVNYATSRHAPKPDWTHPGFFEIQDKALPPLKECLR